MPSLDLPSTLAASTTAQISQFFTDLSPITILIVGLLGVSLVISIIIAALHGHK